ncbi:MAG: haloacid dehalogenase-like hydrolase [Fibrobacter sp.]|nr:haloacid dehalogenase-like hydrolase [Fibrobacter sp.]
MQKAPFEQNIIAMVWDCDKTLISKYMQEPLFRHYNVDGEKFWSEVNKLKAYYGKQGISVNSDTSYLNHILTYVKAGLFKGLNNNLLRTFGKELCFYPGLPEFFDEIKQLVMNDPKYKMFDIRVEHYVVSTGFAETIRGSAIAPYVDGIFGCEFIENPAQPGFDENMSCKGEEISQIATALDNTSKTRYLFEINKGSNKHAEIDVNSTIERSSRRVPFENMIYIADGPSDVPAFSILNYNNGATFAVYPKGDIKAFKQADALRKDGRVQMFGEADYTELSQSWLWLTEKVRSIADKIVKTKHERISQSASAPPSHL